MNGFQQAEDLGRDLFEKYTATLEDCKITKFSKDKYGKSFMDCTPANQKELLTAIESKKDIPENVAQFYATTKGYTLQAFMSSKEYLTDVANYKMVPGSNFKGCVPVKQA